MGRRIRPHPLKPTSGSIKVLGLDPNVLSYFHAGLDEKLVGVEGTDPISEIIA